MKMTKKNLNLFRNNYEKNTLVYFGEQLRSILHA